MAQLSDIFNAILGDLLKARKDSDIHSSQISEEYLKHEILRHFPIPRIEIASFEIELKFAFKSIDENKAEVIVETDKLRDLPETSLTSVRMNATLKNYLWIKDALDDNADNKLIHL